MLKIVNSKFSWSNLSSLRTAGALKIGYIGLAIIPAVSFFIISINDYLGEASNIKLPWTLFLAFMGSIFLAIGHFLNEVLCPQLIKNHPSQELHRSSISKYIKDQTTILEEIMNRERRAIELELTEKFPLISAQAANDISSAVSEKLKHISEDSDQNRLSFIDHDKVWDKENTSLLSARFFISALYLLSLVILATLIFSQSVTVFRAAFLA